jgi:hypothetical protein
VPIRLDLFGACSVMWIWSPGLQQQLKREQGVFCKMVEPPQDEVSVVEALKKHGTTPC